MKAWIAIHSRTNAPVLGIRTVRYDRDYPALATGRAVGCGVVTLVGDCHARSDVWADVEGDLKLGCVAGLTAGQMEGDGQTVEIRLEVDFR
jgi:hypothetical protein